MTGGRVGVGTDLAVVRAVMRPVASCLAGTLSSGALRLGGGAACAVIRLPGSALRCAACGGWVRLGTDLVAVRAVMRPVASCLAGALSSGALRLGGGVARAVIRLPGSALRCAMCAAFGGCIRVGTDLVAVRAVGRPADSCLVGALSSGALRLGGPACAVAAGGGMAREGVAVLGRALVVCGAIVAFRLFRAPRFAAALFEMPDRLAIA